MPAEFSGFPGLPSGRARRGRFPRAWAGLGCWLFWFVEFLPCLLVHSKPLLSDLAVQVAVAHGGLFQPGAERLLTLGGHVVLHRAVNKPTALSRLGQPVDGADRGF